jgi:hypothetical protein
MNEFSNLAQNKGSNICKKYNLHLTMPLEHKLKSSLRITIGERSLNNLTQFI